MQKNNSPRGYTVLLAVMITSAVLAAATALAGIIISEIKQTRDISNSIQARSYAESDLEQAFFILRKAGNDALKAGEFTIGDTVRNIQDIAPQFPFQIPENDMIALSVPYNFEDTVIIGDSTRNLKIEPPWTTEDPDCPSWVEISRVKWDGVFTIDRQPYPRPQGDVLRIPIEQNTVELRIRALYCGISSLTVGNLSSYKRIQSRANFKGVQQFIQAIIPNTTPISGLFDFVVFSECNLAKSSNPDAVIQCPFN